MNIKDETMYNETHVVTEDFKQLSNQKVNVN